MRQNDKFEALGCHQIKLLQTIMKKSDAFNYKSKNAIAVIFAKKYMKHVNKI